jgi:hypothetical protein
MPFSSTLICSLKLPYSRTLPPTIPPMSNSGGTGAAVTWARMGRGSVSARKRMSKVRQIRGEVRKTLAGSASVEGREDSPAGMGLGIGFNVMIQVCRMGKD